MQQKNETLVAATTAQAQKNQFQPVIWDVPVRLFHWLLVASVVTAAATGFLAPEWWLGVHIYAGIAIGALLVARIVWGFYGTTYARFGSFLFSPRQTIAHLRGLFGGGKEAHAGHNPAGAAMVFALFLVLFGLVLTGFVLLGGQEKQGILKGIVSYADGRMVHKPHEILALLLLAMIAAHLAGVVFESLRSRDNLVRAMITGRKEKLGVTERVKLVPAAPVRALGVVALLFLLGSVISWPLLNLPPTGVLAMPVNDTFQAECGDCHRPYHPSLLPAASWASIVTGLSDHFGEDASLNDTKVSEIAKYLQAFSAEHWDTEAANNLRRVSADAPTQITRSSYWLLRHRNIPDAVFKRKSIGFRGNCEACHQDAASGRFADQMIAIPAN